MITEFRNEGESERKIDDPFMRLLHYVACLALSPFGYHDRTSPTQRSRAKADAEAARLCPYKIEPPKLA